MEPELDILNVIPFASTQEFELAATTRDENEVQVYVPQRFVTRTDQLVTDVSLDPLTSVLLRTVAVLPSSQDEEPNLGLLALSRITLGGQGSPDEKAARQVPPFCARPANTCCLPQLLTGHHSVSFTARTLSPCLVPTPLCQRSFRCKLSHRGKARPAFGDRKSFTSQERGQPCYNHHLGIPSPPARKISLSR